MARLSRTTSCRTKIESRSASTCSRTWRIEFSTRLRKPSTRVGQTHQSLIHSHDARNVIERLGVRRYVPAIALDGLFPGVIRRKRKLQIAVEPGQQVPQIARAPADILLGIVNV